MAEQNYEELKQKLHTIQAQLAQAEKDAEIKKLEAAPLQTIYKWDAPNRIYTEKGRPWFVVVSFGFVFAIAVAALTQEPILILALVALMILVFVSNVVKPKLVSHEITNKGVRSANQLYLWRSIEGFWLSQRSGQYILIIDLAGKVNPYRALLLLGTADPVKIIELLSKHVPYLSRKEIGEDIINVFTLGRYQSLSNFISEK